MPIIRPMSELRNKTKEIREICRKLDQPVFLTHNGHGNLVVMSLEYYEKQLIKNGLYAKLKDGEATFSRRGKGHSKKEVMKELRARARAK